MRGLGIALVVLGLLAVVYQGISWTRRDTVIDAGPIEVTRDTREGIAIPPVAGALILVAGVALLVMRPRG
jgi:Na+-transporting methylmalonyl-CoA/oxaloacetate decarboxylase gamma subunit